MGETRIGRAVGGDIRFLLGAHVSIGERKIALLESTHALIALVAGEHQRLGIRGPGGDDLANRSGHRNATLRIHGVQPFASEEFE